MFCNHYFERTEILQELKEIPINVDIQASDVTGYYLIIGQVM